MKHLLTAIFALLIFTTAFAQNGKTGATKQSVPDSTVSQTDSVTFFERVGEDISDGAKKGYTTVKNGVVIGYEATEEAVVKGYKATEGAVVKGHGAVSGWFKKVFGKQPRKKKE